MKGLRQEFLYIKFKQGLLEALHGRRFQDYLNARGVFKTGSSAFNFCVETKFSTTTISAYSSFEK